MSLNQTRQQDHKLLLLIKRQRRQNLRLNFGHGSLNVNHGIRSLRGHHQKFASSVRRVSLTNDPALGLQTANHRARCRGVKRHPFCQTHLVNAGTVQQSIQQGKLHRCDVGIGQVLSKNRHGYLVRAPDQMARGFGQVDALDHMKNFNRNGQTENAARCSQPNQV